MNLDAYCMETDNTLTVLTDSDWYSKRSQTFFSDLVKFMTEKNDLVGVVKQGFTSQIVERGIHIGDAIPLDFTGVDIVSHKNINGDSFYGAKDTSIVNTEFNNVFERVEFLLGLEQYKYEQLMKDHLPFILSSLMLNVDDNDPFSYMSDETFALVKLQDGKRYLASFTEDKTYIYRFITKNGLKMTYRSRLNKNPANRVDYNTLIRASNPDYFNMFQGYIAKFTEVKMKDFVHDDKEFTDISYTELRYPKYSPLDNLIEFYLRHNMTSGYGASITDFDNNRISLAFETKLTK